METLLVIWFTLVLPDGEPVRWRENFWTTEECQQRYEALLAAPAPSVGGETLAFSFTPCAKR